MTDPGAVRAASADVPPAATDTASLEPRYRELFEGALLAIYVSRPDGRLLHCNAAFARMLGFGSVVDAVRTRLDTIYTDGEERERFLDRLREQKRLEHYRGRLRCADGGTIDVIETVIGQFDAAGELSELVGFLIDVTANVEAEAALVERARQFRAVFLDAADSMLILDDSRTIMEANPAAGRMFGIEIERLVTRSLDGLLVEGGDTLVTAWRELLALGEAKREHRVTSTGGNRLVECSYRAKVHGDRHLCVARDITDRRMLEERLMQSEKIESVGRLAGGIAHDFNNLLTAILGYTELLLGHCGDNAQGRADLEEIRKAGQRAAALTQQLLAFSRKQVLMPKDVDLNVTVASLRAMLMRLIREDITLSCELASEPAVVRIDPTQIEQAILNLVLNARDAIAAGGNIGLEVARVRPWQVDVPPDLPSTSADYVRLRVVDDGVGLSPEVRAHLFEPFFTTKDIGKGTGLGLASVYGIVRQSNGFITVESQAGKGTTFTMHFPAAVGVDAVESAAVEPASPPRGPATILLVEDEDAVRVVISTVLRRQGYRVLEASSPRAACDVFDQHRGEINLLLTDVVMPEMNGPALAQRLVAVRPELRILFISGYADMTTLPGADNPNVSFLSKPFQASVLSDRVRDILSRPERARVPR